MSCPVAESTTRTSSPSGAQAPDCARDSGLSSRAWSMESALGWGDTQRVQDVVEQAVAPAAREPEAARAQGAPLAAGEVGMVEDADNHGVDSIPYCHTLALDEMQRHRRLEGLHQDEARAVGDRRKPHAEPAPGARHG